MSKFFTLFIFTAIFFKGYAQNVNITATSGTLSGSYSTLKIAFDNINNGVHKGVINISIINSTTETVSAVLNASSGPANYSTVTIQPGGGASQTISGSLAAPLIDLNGADNVTIDGLNTGGNSLTFSNASTSNVAGTSSIRLRADATNNTVTNCGIEGSETGSANGTILFFTGTSTGNDGNTISNNRINSAGGNLPFNAIYSAGTSTVIDNSNVSITNNSIQDYYNPIGASNGILVASNSSAWTITGNKFFQTATRTATASAASPFNVHRAINIITASGVGYTVSNNIIGYASSAGTGITVYDGAFTNRFLGVEMTVGTVSASSVQGNVVNGISLSTTSGFATAPGIFSGISILGGNVNVGTTSGNTIGSTTGTGSISITATTTGSFISGIYATSSGTVSIQNNNIGSINTVNSALIGYLFNGINTAGTGNFTTSSNIIGSTTTSGSIAIGDINTTIVCTLNGINNTSTGTKIITGNTIQNCSVYGTAASVFNGITNSGAGAVSITSNTIQSCDATGTGAFVFSGILNSTATTTSITGNTVQGCTASSSGASIFNGISNSAGTGVLDINTNNILSGTNTGTGTFTAIFNSAAATTNNINYNVIRNHIRTAASGAFIGISNTGAATSAINITNNQLGNSSGGALTFTNASTGTITGIINNAGTATTTVTIENNSLQGFSVLSSGVFTGISNAGAAGVGININYNQIGTVSGNAITYSAANTTAINGIVSSGGAASTLVNINYNTLKGFSGISSSAAFTGISNTVGGGTININYNQLGNSSGGVLTLTASSTGTITGIINNAGIAATTVSINNNLLQGISVVSSGIFTGISNVGAATGVAININNNQLGSATAGAIIYSAANTTAITGISNTGGSATATVNINTNTLIGFSGISSTAAFTGITNTGAVGVAININYNQLGNSTGGILAFTAASTGAITGIINNAGTAATTVSINNNLLQGFSVVSSGAFTGISNAGATGVGININNNQLGNSSVGAFSFSALTGNITGITNSGGASTTTVSIYNNSLAGFSGASAAVFIGINNSVAGSTIDITSNQLGSSTKGILTFTNSTTGAITGILSAGGAAGSTINLNSNSLQGFSLISSSAVFTGISNTGAAGVAININTNQLGNSTGGILTMANASTGAITGISNNAGISTSTITINNNSLQGFSVVSTGVFTGIINAGILTGVGINITNNHLGTSTGGVISYSAANTTAINMISNTGGASTCALSIQSNDVRGIVHTVAGTSVHTYIINSAATLSQNISTNTFTNLNVNTTGNITFISNNVIVSATGTQHVDGNSISGTFTRTNTSASGVLNLFTSAASSVSGGVITNSNNNFSNITVSGTATISGWVNTDAGSGTKTLQGNTFNNWVAGAGTVIAMDINITATGNAVTGNTISNINSAANITGITTGAGNDNIFLNTITSLISTGAGATVVNGIVVTAGTAKNIYKNTITGLSANNSNLTGNIQNSLSVNGVWVSGGTTINVYQNIISGFTADAIDAGTINGITVSGGSTVTISRNKIYNLSSNSTAINAGGISGIFIFNVAGSVTNIINNIIGDIRTPVSGNSDSYRGISINTSTTSDINVYFNTIYLNSTSTGANFGSTGIYHAFSANSLIGKLDLRNNIITNLSTPTGTGITALFRQYGAALNNYASTSNNNLYYAGPPGPQRVIFLIDPTSSDQTLATFKARLGNREGQSFTEDVTLNFLSLVGSSPYFLHIDSTICTRLESGGINISGITDDYDGQIRQGNTGYTGTGSAPDIGADEFEGNAIPTGVLSGPSTICNGSTATLSLAVIGNGTISGTLSNGTAFSGVAPTITVSVSPLVATTYTIATLNNSACTSLTSDRSGTVAIAINARPTAVITGTQTICSGNSATLSLAVTGTGTISGTLSNGTTFSGTAPVITVNVNPVTTTTYTIANLNNVTCTSIIGDLSGSAIVTVTPMPNATISFAGSPYCSGAGTANITFAGTPGGVYTSTTGLTINPVTGAITLGTSTNGNYTVTYTVAAAGGCSQFQTTTSIAIVTPGTWSGAVNTDWNTSGNWVCGAIPTSSTNVIIPTGLTNYPLINLITASVNNLTIQSGASLTASGGTLQIAGAINNSGMLNVVTGAVEMNGATAQTIPAGAFQYNCVNDLVINNSSVAGVTLSGALDILGSLTYSGTGKLFSTNDMLTLKSTATNTAWLGNMTGNTIAGKVIVERYISARKGWRFLSVPTNTSQTIRETWQEGCSSNNNCVVNFGTQITGPGGVAAGFDLYSATPSLKTYNPITNTWVGVSGTGININATEGYMTFVRGDRTAIAFNSPVTQTVLRTKGFLYTGTLPSIAVASSKFASIGNPYASSLDMRNISKTGVKDFFYVWDPNLSGLYGYGAYQTFSFNGNDYVVTPGMGSYGTSGSVSNFIPSGQAFFVQGTSAGGSITFGEGAKTPGSIQASRPFRAPGQQLRTNLYGVNANGTTYMADGVFINYDDNYSNTVDDLDALKTANTSENLSIKTGSNLLVVERRHTIDQDDTIQLNLSGVSAQAYRFELITDKLDEPGMTGYFEDSYLNTRTPIDLNGTTLINFTIVNIPGSYASNRFRIVFQEAKVLPLSITNVKAYQQDQNIKVDWSVQNEVNLTHYEVEHSGDGNLFTKVHTTAAKNTIASAYTWTDVNALAGFNYYRIKRFDLNGKTLYSRVVKVFMGSMKPAISVFPNPVKDGIINLQFENHAAGVYGIRLLNKSGQVMITTEINHTAGSRTGIIKFDKYIPHGVYQLQINKPDGNQSNITVIY